MTTTVKMVDLRSPVVPLDAMDSNAIHPVAARALAYFDELFPLEPPIRVEGAAISEKPAPVVDPAEAEHWLNYLQCRLPKPKAGKGPLVLDLFAGAGGLALGFETAGFETVGFEYDEDAAATYNKNLAGECKVARITVGFDYGVQPDVIIGGPPCQPFSVIGHQRGPNDSRDGFPALLDAVNRYRPKIVLVENVRGLMYRNRSYLDGVVTELRRLGYDVEIKLLKAVDFGVPQNRERVVIVAHTTSFQWPSATVAKPVSAGVALGEMALSAPSNAKYLTASQDRYIAVYEAKSKCVRPRDLHLDKPARTLTCRNLGASTSDMQRIRLPDGRRRMLLNREGARLQSFPDWFDFVGGEYSVAKQIGNAVPPLMSRALGDAVMASISGESVETIVGQMELTV
jgi:DNA (cytosine-5)-methyltransferase 1